MTAGQETYGSGRFLDAGLAKDGEVVLDFNKAYNPPCAFTPYATCPLPPKENRLASAHRGRRIEVQVALTIPRTNFRTTRARSAELGAFCVPRSSSARPDTFASCARHLTLTRSHGQKYLRRRWIDIVPL